MTDATQADPQPGREAARDSFSGRTLTSSQFNEAWAIAAILHEKIQATGSFRETLTDYAHAYARPERFDALRGETILRDIYQGRYGQSMNQTREGLIANEEALPETARNRALTCAETIGELIQKAPTQPFYQAYDRAAVTLAGELQITQAAAKTLMKESYQTAHNRDLYEAGKEIEDAYHRPCGRKQSPSARRSSCKPALSNALERRAAYSRMSGKNPCQDCTYEA